MSERERFQRIKQLFLACARLPGGERAILLERECSEDVELRAEVEVMLHHHARSDAPLPKGLFERELDQGDREDSDEVPERPVLPERIGRYRVLRLLGRGGMGVVYLAEQPGTGRHVAVKVVRADASSQTSLRRFQREIRLLAMLEHGGIARIFDAEVADAGQGPLPHFAMEYVDGRPIDQHVAGESLSVTARLALFVRICEAVEYAHARGVIHRDLKPANVLVDATGAPRIIDFGVARVTETHGDGSTLETGSHVRLGTLRYMSPEQIDGDPKDLDERSDVYALGVILYELLAGRPPYALEGKTSHSAANTIRIAEPTPLERVAKECGASLSIVVHRALAKEPARRYASVADLSRDVRHVLRGERPEAKPDSLMYRLRRRTVRHRATVWSSVALVFGIGVGAAVIRWGSSSAGAAELSPQTARRAPVIIAPRPGWPTINGDPGSTRRHPFPSRRNAGGLELAWRNDALRDAEPLITDLDSDGVLDIAVTDTNTLRGFDGSGVERWSRPTEATLSHAADLDGDGASELFLVHMNDERYLTVQVIDGRGEVQRDFECRQAGYDANVRVIGDRGDRIFTGYSAGYGVQPRGVGALSLASNGESWYRPLSGVSITGSFAIGDVDRDGELEIAAPWWTPDNAVDENGSSDALLHATLVGEDGELEFLRRPASAWDWKTGPRGVLSAMMPDLDGDGTPELLYLEGHEPVHAPGRMHIYRVAPDGTLITSWVGPENGVPVATVLADVDGDGTRELAVSSNGSDESVFLLGGAALTLIRTEPGAGCVLGAADWDGDGAEELFVHHTASGRLRMLDGANLAERADFDTGGLPHFGISGLMRFAIGDVTGDGKLELVIGASSGLIVLQTR